jgi:hypothetical protein
MNDLFNQAKDDLAQRKEIHKFYEAAATDSIRKVLSSLDNVRGEAQDLHIELYGLGEVDVHFITIKLFANSYCRMYSLPRTRLQAY